MVCTFICTASAQPKVATRSLKFFSFHKLWCQVLIDCPSLFWADRHSIMISHIASHSHNVNQFDASPLLWRKHQKEDPGEMLQTEMDHLGDFLFCGSQSLRIELLYSRMHASPFDHGMGRTVDFSLNDNIITSICQWFVERLNLPAEKCGHTQTICDMNFIRIRTKFAILVHKHIWLCTPRIQVQVHGS